MSFNDWAKEELLKKRKVVIHVISKGNLESVKVVECPDDVEVEVIEFEDELDRTFGKVKE